jgi:hypothetical protein
MNPKVKTLLEEFERAIQESVADSNRRDIFAHPSWRECDSLSGIPISVSET